MRASHDDLDERLGTLVAARPDLAPAATLQRALLGRMIATVCRLDGAPSKDRVLLRAKGAIAHMKQGVPFLRDAGVEIPVDMLAPELAPLSDALAEGGAGDPARHIAEALRAGRIDERSLLDACFRRDQGAVRTFAWHAALAPDLLWLIAELAAGPFAFVLQAGLFEDGEAAQARDAWDRGSCPACGSWPAFAELSDGTRHLRCSFCAAAWHPRDCRCVYCAEDGPAFSLAALDPDTPTWRLELCGGCGGYLKSIDAPASNRYPLLAVDDMETTPLDVAAMDRGYGRPPLPEFGTLLSTSATKPPCRPQLSPRS